MYTDANRSSVQWNPIQVGPGLGRDRELPAAFPLDLETARARTTPIPSYMPMSMTEALSSIGLPQLPALSPEQELIELLRRAAEVEHGLMVAYLYALYSAKNIELQGILKKIAIEEMGHLITVQNLLLAGGQTPYLGRYDWSGDREFEPFPFRLEPASKHSIAKYTVCEMPDPKSPHIDPADKILLPDIYADATAHGGMQPMRIGLLYAAIYWLLRKDDAPLANPAEEPWDGFPVAEVAADPKYTNRHVGDDFFKNTTAQQAKPGDWKTNHPSVIVEVIAGRQAALEAVAKLTEQGEGFGGTSDGHFDRFVHAYRIAKVQTDLAHPVPINPWYGQLNPGDPANRITSPDGEKFARLGDQLYELALLATAICMALPASIGDARRSEVAKAAVDVMMGGLRRIGGLIVSIERDPAQPNPPNLVSHIGFVRPASEPRDPAALLARMRAAIEESAAAADQIASTTTKVPRRLLARGIANLLRDSIRPVFDQIQL